jgi:hypothetical protein
VSCPGRVLPLSNSPECVYLCFVLPSGMILVEFRGPAEGRYHDCAHDDARIKSVQGFKTMTNDGIPFFRGDSSMGMIKSRA